MGGLIGVKKGTDIESLFYVRQRFKYISESLFVFSVRTELVEGWFDRLTTNGETFVYVFRYISQSR